MDKVANGFEEFGVDFWVWCSGFGLGFGFEVLDGCAAWSSWGGVGGQVSERFIWFWFKDSEVRECCLDIEDLQVEVREGVVWIGNVGGQDVVQNICKGVGVYLP